ncbi:MAG TPA: hypothetical protein PLD88_04070, partial [Candidatus Berkiella sp.]|nr:hypothetical protein [Candidatus Berkiella sp.]
MALYGPAELQQQIKKAYEIFFNVSISKGKFTEQAMQDLLLGLERIARSIDDSSQLTFNVLCQLEDKNQYSSQNLLNQFKLFEVENALAQLARKYQI